LPVEFVVYDLVLSASAKHQIQFLSSLKANNNTTYFEVTDVIISFEIPSLKCSRSDLMTPRWHLEQLSDALQGL